MNIDEITGGSGSPGVTAPPVTESRNSETTVSTATLPSPVPLPAFADIVPTEYKDKPWAQDFAKAEKPFEAMFKWAENAQKTIGQKGIEIPGENAAPEVVAAFNKARGVPDKPEAYAYTPPDISKEPEAVQKALGERAKDTTLINTMRQEALKAGVTPKEFAALASAFDTASIQQTKAQIENQAKAAAAFNENQMKVFKEMYGDQADTVKRVAQEALAKVVPEDIRKSGDANLALAVVGKYLHDKLFKSDTVSGANQGVPAPTKEVIHAKIMELRAKPEFKNWQHPNYPAIKKQVESLYDQMSIKNPDG